MIGYVFNDPALLETALTHRSHANETGAAHNERLEFLGDAVLGLIAAEYLYGNNPHMQEGELTKLRAGYVCEESLAAAARRLGLGEKIRLGRGEKADGGEARNSILADAFEAVLAAVYLDGGMAPCRELVKEEVLSRPPGGRVTDAKSRLQELLQAQKYPSPEYRTVSESGPDHQKSFVVEVLINGSPVSQGGGRSKKAAEMAAAERAISMIWGASTDAADPGSLPPG